MKPPPPPPVAGVIGRIESHEAADASVVEYADGGNRAAALG
jgi:hypothetical protein